MAEASHYHSSIQCELIRPHRNPPPRLVVEPPSAPSLEAVLPQEPWTYISCPFPPASSTDYGVVHGVVHDDTIVLAIASACRVLPRVHARSSTALFLHRDSALNQASLVLMEDTHMPRRAEIHAALRAMEMVRRIRQTNADPRAPPGPWVKLRRVIIKTQHEYLVYAMTDQINFWRRMNYVTRAGPVPHRDLFQQLERKVNEMNALGVLVQFWHVTRDRNGPADFLANEALTGANVMGTTALQAYFENHS